MPITTAEARAITTDFVRTYPGARRLAYKFRENMVGLYGVRASEVPANAKGGYIPIATLFGGRRYQGQVHVPLQNVTDADDLVTTLRHEVLGHFGANTFSPREKRALLDGLIGARGEPSLKPLWEAIDRRYADAALDMRAEEVFALHFEGIEPSRHLGIDRVKEYGQQAFLETCIDRTHTMRLSDLDEIALMVAQGMSDGSRAQQTFPQPNAQFRKDETMEPRQETIFIAGSMSIDRLDPQIKVLIDAAAAQGHKFVVGDAPGIDTLVQQHLIPHKDRVTVFHSAYFPRNNVGDFATQYVPSMFPVWTRAFHEVKDKAMTSEATRGIMVWDGKSRGTAANIARLAKQGKDCMVRGPDGQELSAAAAEQEPEPVQAQQADVVQTQAEQNLFIKDYAMEPDKPFYEVVAQKLEMQLQLGEAPWQRAWQPGELQLPYNPANGNEYRGINTLWLMMQGRDDPRWMTRKQAEAAGAQVRDGEEGTRVMYWKFHDHGAKLERPRAFFAVMYNAEQIDGLPEQAPKIAPDPQRSFERVEAIVANAGVSLVEGDRAYYTPATDVLTMPPRQQFESLNNYYAGVLQGVIHATGHPDRLNRDGAHPPGSMGAAREAMVAAIAGMTLQSKFGLGNPGNDGTAHASNWIMLLAKKPRELLRIAADAEKAHGHVMSYEREDQKDIVAAAATRQQFAEGKIDERAFRAAIREQLKCDLPPDWNGRIQLHGNVMDTETYQRDGKTHTDSMVISALQAGRDPEFWSLYAQCGDGTHELVEDFKTEKEAQQFAERLTRVYALSADAPQAAADRAPTLHEPPEPSTMKADRTYLAVPYDEKDQAKALGAKWDKSAKAWYAPEGVDVGKAGLARWLPERVQSAQLSPKESFAKAIRAAGLELEGEPKMDGKIYRVHVDGDKGAERSGSYAGHMEGRIPGGYIQNFRTGERVNWKYEGKVESLSPAERAQQNAEAIDRAARREAETAAKHEATAKIAQALWDEAPFATANNPYCMAKGIAEPGERGLRIVPAAVSKEAHALGIRVAKTPHEARLMREAEPNARVFTAGDLLIPAREGGDGKLWSLQAVNPDFKGFMRDGRKTGLFTVAGAVPAEFTLALQRNPNMPLVLAEGYATADATARLLGHPVVVAFDSGNLDAVARQLRARYPERTLLIAADNDHNAPLKVMANGKPGVNVGLQKAHDAAEKYGGAVMAPKFAKGDKGSDWNDYAAQHGDDAARAELARQLAVAKTEAAMNAERMATIAREREAQAHDNPATSADDAQAAKTRTAAHDLMAQAITQGTEARAEATDALVSNATGKARPVASVITALGNTKATMLDKVKEQREATQNGYNGISDDAEDADQARATKPQQKTRRPRVRGYDAAM